MKTLKRKLLPLFLLFMLCLFLPSTVHAAGKSIRILFIGNSHVINSTEYLYDILKQTGYKNITIASCHTPGVGISNNYKSAMNNTHNGHFRYTTNGHFITVSAKSTINDALDFRKWDYIVLQTQMSEQGFASSFLDKNGNNYAVLFADYIRAKVDNPNLKIGWQLLWTQHNGLHCDDIREYYNGDNAAHYAAGVENVRTLVWETGFYDFMVYTGAVVENLETSYLADYVLDGYYRQTGTYNYYVGFHMGGLIGSYTAGMCFAKAIGADISKVTKFHRKSEQVKYTLRSSLHLNTIRKAINETWKNPWNTSWNNTTKKPVLNKPKLSVSVHGRRIKLSWTSVKGKVGDYEVYRRKVSQKSSKNSSNRSLWKKVTVTEKTSYTTYTGRFSPSYQWKVIARGDGIIADTTSNIVTSR